MVNEEILRLEGVSASYDGSDAVLKNINLSIKKGEFVAVVGKSGCGKSSLFRLITFLLPLSDGQIYFQNENITKLRGKKLASYRSKVSLLFQNYNLVENMSVAQNVLLGSLASYPLWRCILSQYPASAYEKAKYCLSKVGLEDKAYAPAADLSGGQKQRVAVARAIFAQSELLLADEPVSSLDKLNSCQVLDLFKKLNKENNMSIIVNIHDLDLAKTYADRLIGIVDGHILFDKSGYDVTENDIKNLYEA